MHYVAGHDRTARSECWYCFRVMQRRGLASVSTSCPKGYRWHGASKKWCGRILLLLLLQYSTVQHSTVQCSAVQYSTVQSNAVQYNTVQCSANTGTDIEHKALLAERKIVGHGHQTSQMAPFCGTRSEDEDSQTPGDGQHTDMVFRTLPAAVANDDQVAASELPVVVGYVLEPSPPCPLHSFSPPWNVVH